MNWRGEVSMLMLGRSKGFSGGLFLPRPRVDMAGSAVETLAAPEVLRVPLAQGEEGPSRAVVDEGQVVGAGDLLGEGASDCGRVHSPVAGTVGRIVRVDTPYQSRVPAVEVRVGAEGAGDRGESAAFVQRERLSRRELLEVVLAAGIDLPEAAALAERERVETIIVSGVDPTPYETACARLVIEHAGELVWIASLLREVFGARRAVVAVDAGRPSIAAGVRDVAYRYPVRVTAIQNKYPQGFPELLAKTVTGVDVPHGKRPIDVGVWVLDACTALAVCRAVTVQSPCTWHVMTVAGDAVGRPGNYRVALGVSIRDIVGQLGLRATPRAIVVGSLLNGRGVATPDTVLTKRTGCLSVWGELPRRHRAPETCIRCAACVDVCPVGIDARALHEAAERHRFDAAASLRPGACVDCGLCSYVCPSSLPLMQSVQRCRDHVVA